MPLMYAREGVITITRLKNDGLHFFCQMKAFQRSRGYAPAANAEILWEELRREEFDCCHPGLENRIAGDHPGAIHQAPSILDLVRAGRGYAGPVIMITGHLGQYVPNCIFNPIPPGVRLTVATFSNPPRPRRWKSRRSVGCHPIGTGRGLTHR
jgi:hypothetical protein